MVSFNLNPVFSLVQGFLYIYSMEWVYYQDRVVLMKEVQGHFIDDWKPVVGFKIKQEYKYMLVNLGLNYSEPIIC